MRSFFAANHIVMEINVIPEHFEPPTDRFPFPSPFLLSSVERNWCREAPDRILYIKRRHLEENLKTIAQEIGMEEPERKRFMDYWCSPSRFDRSEPRAERDECFNLRQRAESWMENVNQRNGKKPGRVANTIDTFNEVEQWINGRFSDKAGDCDADNQFGD